MNIKSIDLEGFDAQIRYYEECADAAQSKKLSLPQEAHLERSRLETQVAFYNNAARVLKDARSKYIIQ